MSKSGSKVFWRRKSNNLLIGFANRSVKNFVHTGSFKKTIDSILIKNIGIFKMDHKSGYLQLDMKPAARVSLYGSKL